jgi:hypothetical protein
VGRLVLPHGTQTCREVKSKRVKLVAARAVRWTRHPAPRRLSGTGFTPLTAQVNNTIAQGPEVSYVTSRKYKSPGYEVDGAANGAVKAERAASKPVWTRCFFGQAHTRTSPGPPQDVPVVSDLYVTRIHPTTRPGGQGKRQSTYILRHAQTRFFLGRWRAQSSSGPTTHLKRDPQTVVPDIRRPLVALCGPLTRAKMWVVTPSGASTSWWGTSVCLTPMFKRCWQP